MNYKTTIALVVLLIAVGAYFYFVEFGKPSNYEAEQEQLAHQADKPAGKPLFNDVTAEAINSLTLLHGDTSVTAERVDGKWMQTKPVRFPLNPQILDDIAGQIAGLRYLETIDTTALTAPNDNQMGLDNPRATLICGVGDQTLTIHFGKLSLGGQVYLQVEGDENVYVVNSNLYGALLDKPTTTWRRRTLDLPTATKAESAVITPGKGEAVGLVRADGRWAFDSPKKQRVSQEKVDNWFNNLGRVSISSFVKDNPQRLELYGLSRPYLRIDVGLPDDPDSADAKSLLIGNTDLEGKQRYAAIINDDEPIDVVFTISLDSVEPLMATESQLRDPKVVDADELNVRGLVVKQDGKTTLNLLRDPATGYSFGKPAPSYEPDYMTCHGMLSALCGLTSTDFVENRSSLGEPSTTAILSLVGDKKIVLSIYPHDKDYAIADGDEDVAYVVPAESLSTLLGPTLALRDRTLLELPADSITKLTLKRDDGQTFTFEPASDKSQDHPWHLVGYDKDAGETIKKLIDGLNPLKADHWLTTAVTPGPGWTALTTEPVGGAAITLKADPATGNATMTGVDASFVLPKAMISLLSAEYRPQAVLGIDVDQLKTVTLAGNKTDVKLTRDGKTYASDKGDVDQPTIAGVFDALAGLRVLRYTQPIDLTPDTSDFTLTATLSNSDTVTMTFAKAPKDSKSVTVHLTGLNGKAYQDWFTLSGDVVKKLRAPLSAVEKPLK